jgi:lysophospholipase L1-like esterase
VSRRLIIALGDSTTAGTPGFLSPLESPPSGRGDTESQYAYWLMKARPNWEVRNRGVNGERSDQIRARFERDVVAASPVAAVAIIAGVNDIYQGRPAEQVIEQLRWMYERARQAGIPVVAGSIVPYNTATPDQHVRMRRVNDWIRAVATREHGVIFADTRAAVAAPDNPDRLAASPDDLHPTAAGYRMMAEALLPAIETALQRQLPNP